MTDGTPRAGPTFYGRRHGRRLRPGQRRLLAERLPALAVALPPAGREIDVAALFGGAGRVELEIGFGAGEHLAWQAAHRPEAGFIGCEAYVNGIARLIGHIEDTGLANIRIWPDDARLLLPALPEAAIARIYVLFPDPWPKTRHARRRLIGPDTLDALARVLADGGELRVASDVMGYVRWALFHLRRHPAFAWDARGPGDWRQRRADWPPTRYEEKARRQGLRPVYLVFRRQPRLDPLKQRPARQVFHG